MVSGVSINEGIADKARGSLLGPTEGGGDSADGECALLPVLLWCIMFPALVCCAAAAAGCGDI